MTINNKMIEIKYFIRQSVFKYYCAEITHKGLNKSVVEECSEESVLPIYIKERIKQLNLEWDLLKFNQCETILLDGLKISKNIDWNNFIKRDQFEVENPKHEYYEKINEIKKPESINNKDLPEKPTEYDGKRPKEEDFTPKFNFMDSIFGKQKKILESQQLYNLAIVKYEDAVKQNQIEIEQWESECITINEFNKRTKAINEKALSHYNTQIAEIRKQKEETIKNWQKENDDFYTEQSNYNKKVEHVQRAYEKQDLNSAGEFAKLILDYSEYPDFVPKRFEVDYNSETKILVVDYALPPIDSFPTLKDYKLIKDEWRGYYISDTQLQKNFEQTMYNITLRTLYELFYTDTINALESICFNGWVNAINKATGKRENNCILSVQTKKEEFLEIDLQNVDPKACFKSLKGVSNSKLSIITSIQPIIQINKTDKRFVDSHDVTDSIDDSTNLASMNWEDFEHLIREVFEKEFKTNGGEVKVTQASRDGGVDAIAFDPDPIRGGKIVIQAKRYTNTVGVSAVRDLYGTVMNEGATKGILVTTSDYGSDSYEFAKGKPLTLLNGSNLLYLLERHGHNAKIDIEEARRSMKS